MNRNVSGKSAGPRQLRVLRAKLGALLRRTSLRLARGETGEARRASIVEASEDAITSSALGGVIAGWNPGAERMYGYTAEEAVGRPVWELMRPLGGSDVVAENVARIKRGESPAPFEATHHHRSGRRLHVSVSLVPVKDAAGGVVGVATISRDITERKEAEEALRRSEERFRSIVQSSSEVVKIVAPDGTLKYASPTFGRVLGYSPEEAEGMNVLDQVHPDDLPRVLRETERAMSEPEIGRTVAESTASGTRTTPGATSRAWAPTCSTSRVYGASWSTFAT